ncbi:AraC family transcriptional regulator N-terminal domain-containing protein [Hyphomicrobium sp.]|jgi:AraC-like DNA-binding protein|uniref:AraC family transcriptional regulator n=1 Tax=Hyphomicrobium sp. TaxID=82 RepID=UPI003565EFF4
MQTALIDALNAYADANGGGEGVFMTPIPGFGFMRTSRETLPQHIIYKPSLCVVVQGEKQVMFGKALMTYREGQALIVNVEIPAIGRVTKASPEKPLIGLVIELDTDIMREVMEEIETPPPPNDDIGLGAFVADFEGPLADCVVRLVRLLATPRAIAVLRPAIMREISFWLLTGSHGAEVCKVVLPNSRTRRLSEAIQVLRNNFSHPVRIDELASIAHMSPSSFHQHFKTLTSMTPLQYQKQLRLLRARHLMSDGNIHVSDAAYQVGYESASQFSREYARMFGTPPKRDAVELRAAPYEPAL